MRIAALADTHLGYRAFPTVRNGRNAREQDVANSWHDAIADVCVAKPDIVTIAGDVMHRSRVSNFAIQAYLTGLYDLLNLTDAAVHVLVGNHEASRSAETMCPNHLAEVLDSERIHIHDAASVFEDEGYQLTALPFQTGKAEIFSFPEKISDKVNILVIHGAIQAPGINTFYAGPECPHIDDLARHFDVIAAGDLHDHTILENDHDCIAFYSGSLDWVSTNFWPERSKGWVLVDTEALAPGLSDPDSPGIAEFRPIPTRAKLDFRADGCTDAESLNARLADLLASDDYMSLEPIVRVVVPDFERSERGGISHDLLKQLKAKCLHFQLDIRTAKVNGADGESRQFRARSLRDMADEFFADDPEEVRDRAFALIDERWAG